MHAPIHLQGKVAIVTGASRGIGEAIARSYAQAGAKVVLSARKLEGLEKVAASIRESGAEATAIACHGGDPAQIQTLVQQTIERYGKVDVLVNNAATNPHFGPMLSIEWPAFDKTFEVNVRGYFAAAKAVAEHLIARGAPGAILNISSILGMTAGPLQGAYAMTKAAVISMTKTLAVELGPNQIRCNAIAPGFVHTKFSSALVESDEIRGMILSKTPLSRIGQPDDISGLALYLASDAASFVTGAVFCADGGLTAG